MTDEANTMSNLKETAKKLDEQAISHDPLFAERRVGIFQIPQDMLRQYMSQLRAVFKEIIVVEATACLACIAKKRT